MRGKFGGMAVAAGAMLALGLPSGAYAGIIQVTSAGDEYAVFHPRPKPARANPAAVSGHDFQATMDRVFGAGRWRETSGYRSPAQEDALRRQGAGAVAPGHLSAHSLGGSEAPGAYDAVVERMSAASAAARLRRAGAPFARVLAEGAHGGQGPHLHIELVSTRPRARSHAASAEPADN